MKRFFRASLYLLLIAAWLPVQSQVVMERKVRFGIILDGDTIPYYRLKDVNVIASASLLSDYEIKHNQKLIRNVKKMLPYAKIGKQRLDLLEQQIADLPKKQRRAAIRAAEKTLLADFSDELKGCTISQGKVLLKLIDRETGRTSYVLVDELRGKLRAGFYQAFARLFGYNLKAAYDQLEEATVTKERMESELRIASNIQMSMIPNVFPKKDGLDMYASMTTAKEVGGDLYNYLLKDNKLYFCIGDVSGKGVPASLFMTIATRGFRALAAMGKSPEEIATRMNLELSENNEAGMFVTMFICMFDTKLGRLEYCNAGHNPPVIGNADGQFSFLDVEETNAPIGLWPELVFKGETIDNFHNRLLLLYTDGLNEAENRQQEQYGEDRIVKLINSNCTKNTHDIVEALKADVNLFRDGAEQNDDLTILAFRYT